MSSPRLPAVREWNRPMLVFACGSAVLGVVAVLGLLVDQRMLGGSPIWVKPLKFAISGVLYGLTWAWLCTLIDRRERTVRRASALIAIMLTVELAVITGQALRGRRSHFNFETLFDAVLYEIMATSIMLVWCGGLVLTILVLRSDIGDRPRKLAVGLGAVISLVGIGVGVLMTFPTGAQLATVSAGHSIDTLGAHTVGAPDGGAGLPFIGWSTTGGDLRISHFVGMHALQILLVWHVVLARLGARWPRVESARARLVGLAAAGYAGVLAMLVWQAYRGQPLTAPDAWTLAVLAVLVTGLAIGAAAALLRKSEMDTLPDDPLPRVPARL